MPKNADNLLLNLPQFIESIPLVWLMTYFPYLDNISFIRFTSGENRLQVC